MKVTILDIGPGEEEEIIIKCSVLTEDMVKLINQFRQGGRKAYGLSGERDVFSGARGRVLF